MSSISVRTLGRYHLLEQIGKGGMASVYRAFDPSRERYLAIKVLSPMMAQQGHFSERFRREAEVVMRLKHPNIVPVEDFGEQDGYAYLVMPLLEVGSLADRLQEGPLSPREGSQLMEEVSSALQFAHDQGVVHRDVKPSNILMDPDGKALLSDFGLARIHDASVSLTGSALLGTPAYMSPEQARGDPVDARSDQYALGVILYQLSTGTLPFEAETPMAVLMKHINEPLPTVRARSPGVPEVVENVILKATAKRPEDRFPSVVEMNQAFQAALAHVQDPFSYAAPKIELPPSTSSIQRGDSAQAETSSTVRRLRRVAALGGLLLLLLLACPLTSPWSGSILDRWASPAEGSVLPLEDMNDPQLTALAGTIQALSTEVADAQDGTVEPDMIPTLVMRTMVAEHEAGGGFGTPSSSATPDPLGGPLGGTGTATPPKTNTPGPSPTPSRTWTPGPSPTASRTPTVTKTWTPGPSPTASKTPTASHTPTPGPSATASKTPTKTPTKTWTPGSTSTTAASSSPPPSKTPTSAPTLVPTKTITPSGELTVPPPTVDVCSMLGLDNFMFGPKEVSVNVYNYSTVMVRIVGIHLMWPPEHERLDKVSFGGSVIWNIGHSPPPTDIWDNWIGDTSLNGGGASKTLTFHFKEGPPTGGYNLELHFDVGCVLVQSG